MRCSSLRGVRFVQGDFRDFNLSQQFDAVVCAHDSLNYIGNANELTEVFRGVARHLRVGGLFAFDTITRRGMMDLSGRFAHFEVNGQPLAIHFEYDSCQCKEKSTVLLPGAVEVHRRTPIDPEDVMSASRNSGLAMEDYFSHAMIPGRRSVGQRCFFLLSQA
jgi:SAM-dependent methyltransferase